jgi:anti-sigma-K factor RskA
MTVTWHESLQTDLAAYALRSLNREEGEAIEAHLRDCAECRSLLHEYQETVRLLPHALPVVTPSPHARARLLASLQGGASPQPRSSRVRTVALRWYVLAAGAAVMLLMTLAFASWDGSGDRATTNPAGLLSDLRERPDVQMLAMTGSEDAPMAVGQIIVDPGDTRAALLVSGLPPLKDGYEYQFWFVQPDNTRVSGGVFTVDSNGAALVAVDAPKEFSRAWRCGVTEEPAGGSPGPTGRNMLTASYDQPEGTEYSEPG